MKYRSIHDEPTTISVDLIGGKSNYQTLQQDQNKGEDIPMEINVASLIKQLKDI